MSNELLRGIPSVSAILSALELTGLLMQFGEGVTKLELRRLLDENRNALLSGARTQPPTTAELSEELQQRLLRFASPQGRKALNATGILLHTGLGRAPLSAAALEAIQLEGYSILQVDLDSGGRSLREEKIERMLTQLTGCEAATVINNNAAATFIILNALGKGKEVIISRGQLIEIGGEFRMPDVMEQSGAILKEVGTTNRTHLRDYKKAISAATAAIIHVHPSNYKIQGFSSTPSLAELSELCRAHSLPLIADLGSGALFPLSKYGLHDIVTIGEALSAGAEITCSSGDKLICGPQAGIICGKKSIVETIRHNPFARMFRSSKLELAALEATLLSYINGDYEQTIPLYRMLSQTPETLIGRANALSAALAGLPVTCSVDADFAYVGGGSLPDEAVPSRVLRVVPAGREHSVERVSALLRRLVPSVFCRVKEDCLLFDMMTLSDGEIEELAGQITKVFS